MNREETAMLLGTDALAPRTFYIDLLDEAGEKRRYALPRVVAAYLQERQTRLRAVEAAGFALTAALAQLPARSKNERDREWLDREAVMELVVRWRMKVDAAGKQPPGKGQENG